MFNEINSLKNKRHTIGFLIQQSTGFGGFQDLVWDSMVNAAKENDINAFIFAGGSIDNAPYNPYEKNLNLVYELIDKKYVNGLIINYSLGNYISREDLRNFYQSFSIPVVSIIGEIKGFPSVRVNNKNGMHDLIFHLINEHNLKKIAFIKGTEGNIDAEERYQVYKDTLKENDISFDSDIVYNGTFDEDSGFKAVDYFIKEKKKDFQAIVASNDAMAFGAIKALRNYGKKVPGDVAVTGFDDTEKAKAFTPSLTTVQQPFKEICSKALKVLCDKIEGKNVEDSIIIPSRLIINQSCGCSSKFVLRAKVDENILNLKKIDQQKEGKNVIINEIINELIKTVACNVKKEILFDIIDCFIDNVEKQQGDNFLKKINSIINNKVIEGQDIFVCQYVVFTLRRWIYLLWSEDKILFTAENIIIQASVMIGEASEQAMVFQKVLIEKKSRDLMEAGQELITTFNINQLKNAIKKQLLILNIPSCFISVFRDIKKDEKDSEIFILYKNNEKDLSENSMNYTKHSLPEKSFLPQNKRFIFAIHPLNFKEYKLGYAMFELGPEDGMVYDVLQVQISSSFMGAKLLSEREKTESMLMKQSKTIQELVKPMLDSISRLTNIIKEKINIINGLVELTKENSEKLSSTNNSIAIMGEKIFKMNEVVKMINDISAVVNMLSINTAIESAHAGQYGRGFSVIAEEIQKLADSIKENTKVISEYLKDISPNIEISRKASRNSQETFKRLEKDVFEVSQTLQLIMNSMNELSVNSSQILSVMNLSQL